MRSSLLFPCLLSLLLLFLKTEHVSGEPGHMVHDYYKCDSEFFRDSIKCREEAERQKALEREGRRRTLSGEARRSNEAAIMWASPARLLSQVTVTLFLLLVLISNQPVSSSPQPGHLVHDFYKCSSKFYYDFSRCKLEREEAARRGLNRRSRQIHHNSASTGQASLVVLALATLWTQKCLW